MRRQGPQIAKVMPLPAWMFTNSVWPSGLNVVPANSSLKRVALGGIVLTSRFNAMSQIWPLGESPRM